MRRISCFSHTACLAIVVLFFGHGLGLHAIGAPSVSDPKPGEPTDPKARKTFADAIEYQKKGQKRAALGEFRKANTQDGGHCAACLSHAYSLAMETGAYKEAESVLRDYLQLAQADATKATLHFQLAVALQREGLSTKKDNYFAASCDEYRTALQLDSSLTLAHYGLGASLAHLHQDDEARAEFKAFLDRDKVNPSAHPRAQRYADRIELARAKMAPPFTVVALDGQHVSMDELTGKVVLIDFWATWCGPCREALPRIKGIAQKFNGQPLVVISISLDSDEAKWKKFVAKNEMTWPQYRDGYFDGPIATLFAVKAIPATFSIDTDGVLEDQHVGDADIEGKLKKMIAQAVELSNRKAAMAATVKASGAAN